MLKFQTTNRNNPCPLCDDVSGDCRSADNGLLFCHSFIDKHQDPAHPDWLYIRPDKSGVWGLFTKRREKENYSRDHWVERSRQLKAEREKEKAARAKAGLSLTERDRALRLLSSEMGLTDADRQRLRDRGLTDDQIKAGLFFSYRPGAKVSDRIPENLPGIRYGKLAGKHSGIGCVAFNSSGQAIGYQIRLNDITDGGKYRWGYGQVSSHLPNHELPLNVARAENPKNQDIGLTEGILKPYVTDCRLQVNCIGAAGGNHSGSPEQLRAAINDLLQENSRIVIFSDAGGILNPNILKQQQNTISLLTSWGHGDRLCFGWWGQVTKDGPDCDEIDPDTALEYLTPEDYFKKARSEQLWLSWRKSKDFTAQIKLNQKYLDYKDFQDNKLYFIKSGLGSGKSSNIRAWINENREWLEYQRLLELGYRNNLLLQECSKLLGLIHIHQFSKEDKMMLSDPTLWATSCLDSLIKFQPDDFDNAVIILDEIVSVIKHLLFSNTEIKKYREKVIYLFSEAIKRARMVICLDGNLADWVVKFMGSLAPDKEIVTIENTYQSERPELIWINGSYKEQTEKHLKNNYKGLVTEILKLSVGHKAICSDSQVTLETIDSLLTEDGKKTLRVDSKTSGIKEVKAFLADPEKWLRENPIDFLLYSPTAESGLDVPITNYFNAHYCLFFGVLDVDSTLQMIARIRDVLCPKFFWAREYSTNQDDFQSPDPNILARCLNERLNLDINRVLSGESSGPEIKSKILETYQRAPDMYVEAAWFINAQRNFERSNYRQCLLERLEATGYKNITETTLYDGLSGEFDRYKETKKDVQIADAKKVFNAEIKPDKELNPEKLEDQYSQRKAKILESLPGIENEPIWSPDFLLKILHTDRQLISQTRRYWLLTNPSVNQRLEQEKFKKAYDRFFDDRYSMPWLDRNDWGKVWALGQSGILEILNHLDPDKPWSASDPEIQTIIQNCKKRRALQLHLGCVGKTNPMQYVGRLLRMVGVGWQSKQVKEGDNHSWAYQLDRSGLKSPEWAAIADAMTRKWAKYLSTDLAPITWEPPASYYEKSATTFFLSRHENEEGLNQSGQGFEVVTPDHDFSIREGGVRCYPICTENLTQNGDSTMIDNQPPVSPDFAPGDRVIFLSVLHGAVLTEIVRITDGGLFALKSGNVCGRNVLKRVG